MSSVNPYDDRAVDHDEIDELTRYAEQQLIDGLAEQHLMEEAERAYEELRRPLTPEEQAERDAEMIRLAEEEPDWYGKY